jgi:alkylation response protein AidB-like acyl-CoA dehydrogenase
MASLQVTLAERPAYSPPPIDGDFYGIANVLDGRERALVKRVRAFAEGVVAPVIEEYWARDEFPFEIIPKMAEVGIGGVGYEGYGAARGELVAETPRSQRRSALSSAARPSATPANCWAVAASCSRITSVGSWLMRKRSTLMRAHAR